MSLHSLSLSDINVRPFVQCICVLPGQNVCVYCMRACCAAQILSAPGMNLQEDDEDGEFGSSLTLPCIRQSPWLESTLSPDCRSSNSKNQSAIAGNKINYQSSITVQYSISHFLFNSGVTSNTDHKNNELYPETVNPGTSLICFLTVLINHVTQVISYLLINHVFSRSH